MATASIGRVGVKGRNIKSLVELAASMAARRDNAKKRDSRRGRTVAPAGDKPVAQAPTAEQMRNGVFGEVDTYEEAGNGRTRKIGRTLRRTPMIDTLAAQGLFNAAEHKALHYYRHHADVVNRSIVRDSLNKERFGGTGNGPTAALISAGQIVSSCERAAQGLVDILRAVVVEDMSLSQWAIKRSGGIEDCEVKKGERVCRIKPRQKALAIAKLEIQMVAKRIEAELGA